MTDISPNGRIDADFTVSRTNVMHNGGANILADPRYCDSRPLYHTCSADLHRSYFM